MKGKDERREIEGVGWDGMGWRIYREITIINYECAAQRLEHIAIFVSEP